MSFIDQVKIYLKAGDGGKGCHSYYYNRRTAKRYPDGGDGGKGGDIIIKTNPNLWDLQHLLYQKHFKAKNGSHGSSNNKKGKDGKDLTIQVPLGTIVKDVEGGFILRELLQPEEEITVAKGGRGGRGNAFTKSEPLPAGKGESKELELELKLLADLGLVGFPNAGKTTLINALCKTRGKVASYPFTTLEPILGTIWDKEKAIKIVDIPGLIEMAHKGKGLGFEFLRHIQRTKALVFVLGLAESDPSPWQAFKTLGSELATYDPKLKNRPFLIVANKIDLPEAQEKFKILIRELKNSEILAISALWKKGLEDLKARLLELLRNA